MPTTSALNSSPIRYFDKALKVIRGEGTGRLIGGIVLFHLVLIFLRPQFFFAPLAWIKFPLLYSFLPLACLLSVWSSRSGKPLPKQVVVMVLFLVLGGVTGLFAVNRSVAFHRWRSMFQLLFTVVLPLALAITGGRQMKLLSKTLVLLGAALGAIGIVSRGTGPGDFLLDENDLCFTLNFLLPFPLLGIAAAKSFPKRLGLTAICGVILAGIVATQSRGGFVGLVCMVLFLLVRSHHRGALLALLLFLGSGAAIFAPKSYWEDMATISQVDRGTAKSRRQFWTVALDMWLDPKNTVWGVGMGNSSYRLLEYQPPELTRVLENRMWGRAVHSTYLQLLPDLGLLGALLVGSMVLKSFSDLSRHRREIRAALKQLPKRTSPLIKSELTNLAGFLLAIQTSWIGVLSTGAFISALYYPPLWLLGAFTVIASHYWRRLKEPVQMGLKTSE